MVPTPLPPLGESRFLAPGSRAPLLSKTQKPASARWGAGTGMLTAGLFITDRRPGEPSWPSTGDQKQTVVNSHKQPMQC